MTPKPLNPDGSLRCAFEGIQGATTWAVIHWFMCTATPPEMTVDVATIVGDIHAAFADAFVATLNIGNFCHLQRTVAVYTTLDGSGAIRHTHVADAVGEVNEQAAPGQVAYLVNWSSRDPRKGGKPRSYIAGVPATKVTDEALVVGGVVDSLTAAAGDYIAAVNALSHGSIDTVKFVSMSFRDNNDWRAEAVTFDIDTANTSPYVATQRRRVDRLRG